MTAINLHSSFLTDRFNHRAEQKFRRFLNHLKVLKFLLVALLSILLLSEKLMEPPTCSWILFKLHKHIQASFDSQTLLNQRAATRPRIATNNLTVGKWKDLCLLCPKDTWELLDDTTAPVDKNKRKMQSSMFEAVSCGSGCPCWQPV